ncbi:MAG TPA: phosphatase PAP2 family protein, partial [Candidatus Acidoferrales bacterium]|nr:phosphatase PAP2 family protein [Candidatus Acidoferrales bacterium]
MGSSRRRKPKATSKPSLLAARRPSAASLRNERILIEIVLLYVAVLVTMVASERYVFVVKSLVVPVLLLAALLSGRLKRFINEWVVFLAAVEFFDFGRGLVFAATSHFELPMHLQYVVAVDRWLCAGEVAPVVVQKLRSYLSNPYWLDRFFFLVYSSHFVFFLIFGLTVWIVRPRAFRTYAIAILATMYGGLLSYFLVPTVPPWMASSQFAAIPEITQFVRTIYNVHLPHLLAAFDVNTIAAMPSVHAA